MLFFTVALAFCCLGSAASAAALGQDIVKDGVAKAEIVIAPERPRMATWAALELQYNLKKISGAELPIVTQPTEGVPVRIYVGQSPATEKLGIDAKGLKYGAFRMVSDNSYLALVGSDYDFTPPQPFAKNASDTDRAIAEWDEITKKGNDTTRGFPFRGIHKNLFSKASAREGMLARYGEANEKFWPEGDYGSGFWAQDEGGSFNAVCAFLDKLGARFYMPGDLGEVIPTMKTIPLTVVDETVKPAYALRAWNWYNMSGAAFSSVLWYRQIGNNSGAEILGANLSYAHGLTKVHEREDFKKRFPEAFALINGKRDTEHRDKGTACFSSPELVAQAAQYARFMFDTYDEPQVSIWPADGIKNCQCELCAGKEPSELVWAFVDKVAKEVYKTHPDRMITCGAYTSYKLAPKTIEKFSPNVAVFASNWSRPMFMDPASWNAFYDSTMEWQKRLAPGHLLRVENNRGSLVSGEDNWRDPFLVPQARAMARELEALKGVSIGEISEQSQKGGKLVNPALNSFPLYTLARYSWNPDQNFDAFLDEYLTEFFGPASPEMKAAYTFAEEAYLKATTASEGKTAKQAENVPIADRIRLVEMLQAARAKAGDTVYGQRVDLYINELQRMETLQAASAKEKKGGKLRDHALLVQIADSGTSEEFSLKDNTDKSKPKEGTTVQVSLEKGALIFTIRCQESAMADLASTEDVVSGDSVAILLEPPGHSFYKIEVNPDGVVVDSDEGSPVGEKWKSLAEVQTERGSDFWQVRVKVPVADPMDGASDPHHNVVGVMPSVENPWFFNVGRTRPSGRKPQLSMLSPGGKKGYYSPKFFVKLAGKPEAQ